MRRARPLLLAAIASFAFEAAAQDELTLLVFGDSGTGKAKQKRAAEAMSKACELTGCDAALVLGDLIYPRGVESVDDELFATRFEEPYAALGPFPFWMAPGNHDHKRAGSVEAQIAYGSSGRSVRWRMPAAHYAVPGLPNWLHIYALDTEPIAKGLANAAQAEQARAALCGRSGWRLLMGHHPIYSSGRHGDNAAVGSYVDEVVRDCGVQAYFAGHDHHQEHLSTDRFEQFVQGAAAKVRSARIVRHAPELRATQQFVRSTLGFAIAELTERSMEVRFFDGGNGSPQEIYRCRATVDAPRCMP